MSVFPRRLNPCWDGKGTGRTVGAGFPAELSPGGRSVGLCVISGGISTWKVAQEQLGSVGQQGCCGARAPGLVPAAQNQGLGGDFSPPVPTGAHGVAMHPAKPWSKAHLVLQGHLCGAGCSQRTRAGGTASYQGLREGAVENFIGEGRRWLQSIINQTTCDSNHTSLFNAAAPCCCLKL